MLPARFALPHLHSVIRSKLTGPIIRANPWIINNTIHDRCAYPYKISKKHRDLVEADCAQKQATWTAQERGAGEKLNPKRRLLTHQPWIITYLTCSSTSCSKEPASDASPASDMARDDAGQVVAQCHLSRLKAKCFQQLKGSLYLTIECMISLFLGTWTLMAIFGVAGYFKFFDLQL